MVAQFYIDNPANSGNVKVSDAAGAADLILPAGAVVLSVSINNAGTAGAIDLGTTGYTSGTATPEAIANNLPINAVGTTSVGSVVTGTASTELAYVTSQDNGATAAGNVGGYITYFVIDPLTGQQNV
jgi:hypothetical protein